MSGNSDSEAPDQSSSLALPFASMGDIPSSQGDPDYRTSSSSQTSERSSLDESTMRTYSKEVLIDMTRLRLSGNAIEAQELLDTLPAVTDGWCRLCTMVPSKSGGYIQVSWKGANKFAMLQEVALWAGGKTLGPGEQCSHRCARSNCMNVDHILAESELKNQNRKGCLVWVSCPHNDICNRKVAICLHGSSDADKCIKYCEGFADHKDFEQRGVH